MKLALMDVLSMLSLGIFICWLMSIGTFLVMSVGMGIFCALTMKDKGLNPVMIVHLGVAAALTERGRWRKFLHKSVWLGLVPSVLSWLLAVPLLMLGILPAEWAVIASLLLVFSAATILFKRVREDVHHGHLKQPKLGLEEEIRPYDYLHIYLPELEKLGYYGFWKKYRHQEHEEIACKAQKRLNGKKKR